MQQMSYEIYGHLKGNSDNFQANSSYSIIAN